MVNYSSLGWGYLMYELLLDDLLAELKTKGIDTSKINLIEDNSENED